MNNEQKKIILKKAKAVSLTVSDACSDIIYEARALQKNMKKNNAELISSGMEDLNIDIDFAVRKAAELRILSSGILTDSAPDTEAYDERI